MTAPTNIEIVTIAPPNSGESETITVVVTVINNQFYFNGELQSEFELIKGNTYIFQQSTGINGHVLGISSTNGGINVAGLNYSYTTGTSSTPISINESTYSLYLTNTFYAAFFSTYTFAISYTVPEDGPDTLYFFSTSSSVNGGTFNVVGGYLEPPPAPPPPTPVDPDALVINENELGAVIGSLVTTDEDVDDTHTYTISGEDADLFEVVDGKLKLKDAIASNFENKSTLNIDLTKIRIKPIFKWLKKNNIKDSEMLKTFNCGVGFCLITNKRNVLQIKKIFSNDYKPYKIGFVSKGKSRIKTFGKLQW